MRARTAAPWIALLGVLAAPAALAGPPLICHPWVVKDAPPAPPQPWLTGELPPDYLASARAALDAQPDTLLRMDLIQRTLMKLDGEEAINGFVDALRKRAEDESASSDEVVQARRSFDSALAAASAPFLTGGSREETVQPLVRAARALGDDPAAWLAVARTVTPLMRSGTLTEHAAAFLRAWDVTAKLPEGDEKARMDAVLRWDLENLEAYTLDPDLKEAGLPCTPDTRLALLRQLAA